jgi:hypothetical protein
MEKWVVNIHSNIPNHDTCAKNKRGFCEWFCSWQKPLLVFKKKPYFFWKACPKTINKTWKKRALQKFWQLLSNFKQTHMSICASSSKMMNLLLFYLSFQFRRTSQNQSTLHNPKSTKNHYKPIFKTQRFNFFYKDS